MKPYHVYLLPPEERCCAYWSSLGAAMTFESPEAAHQAGVASLGDKSFDIATSPIPTGRISGTLRPCVVAPQRERIDLRVAAMPTGITRISGVPFGARSTRGIQPLTKPVLGSIARDLRRQFNILEIVVTVGKSVPHLVPHRDTLPAWDGGFISSSNPAPPRSSVRPGKRIRSADRGA